MFDSYDTIREYLDAVLSPDGNYDTATQYGEPGYTSELICRPFPLVVLGYYWCRCDKFGVTEQGHPELHDIARHYPKTFERLETLGVVFEWRDEWIVDSDNDKAYRTQPNSYAWLPSYVITDDGELITRDDDIEKWIAYAVNDPARVLPSSVFATGDLTEAGFSRHNGLFESGWHPGQADDPSAVLQQIIEHHGPTVDVVFFMDENSQFYSRWSAYWRPREGACRTPHCVSDATDIDAEDGFCPTCCDVMERVAYVIDDQTFSHVNGTVGQQAARVLAEAGLIGGVR